MLPARSAAGREPGASQCLGEVEGGAERSRRMVGGLLGARGGGLSSPRREQRIAPYRHQMLLGFLGIWRELVIAPVQGQLGGKGTGSLHICFQCLPHTQTHTCKHVYTHVHAHTCTHAQSLSLLGQILTIRRNEGGAGKIAWM